MTELSFYLWASDALGAINAMSVIFILILTIVCPFIALGEAIAAGTNKFLASILKHSKKIGAAWAIFLFFIVAIPGEETRRNILLVEVGSSLAELEQTQKIGGEVGELAKETIAMLRKIVREKSETTE